MMLIYIEYSTPLQVYTKYYLWSSQGQTHYLQASMCAVFPTFNFTYIYSYAVKLLINVGSITFNFNSIYFSTFQVLDFSKC